jgi:tetratricopeptide (TPR) repeat protein
MVVSFTVVGALAAFLVLVISDVLRDPILIAEVSVPKQLAEQGLTDLVSANRVRDAVEKIQGMSKTAKGHESLSSTAEQTDFDVPGTGLSVRVAGQILRKLFNRPQTVVSGEIVCSSPACKIDQTTVRVRVTRGHQTFVLDFDSAIQNVTNEGDLFREFAQHIFRKIDPYTLASYYVTANIDPTAGVEIAKELINQEHDDRAWAANLIGLNLRENLKQPERAIHYYKLATSFAEQDRVSGFSIPLINMGHSLSDLGKYEEAIQSYERANVLNPDFASLWNGWGYVLSKKAERELNRAHFEDAISKFKRAIEYDPKSVFAHVNWGAALLSLEETDKALEVFTVARSFDSIPSRAALGIALSTASQGRHIEAVEYFLEAHRYKSDGENMQEMFIANLQLLWQDKPLDFCVSVAKYLPAIRAEVLPTLPVEERYVPALAAIGTCP